MLPAAGLRPEWPAGSGPKVFAYLKAAHPDHGAVLQALVKRGCRTVCYLPEVASGQPPPVVSPLIHYARGPVDLGAALPDSELCICHAGEATLAQALLAGVPLLLLPMQMEQFLIARRVGQSGSGINAAERPRPLEYAAVIGTLLGNSAARRAAGAFAQRYAGFTPQQHTRDLADEFERLLPPA
jgi:UDP:flavonoid glycosyltransferase YjiC (YdhE family)